MLTAHPYLTFNGNCREAMTFYRDCLGAGELYFQTVGTANVSGSLPASVSERIVHAELLCEGLVLTGTDMVPENGRNCGNAVSVLLHCSHAKALRQLYDRLSDRGRRTLPPSPTAFGDLFAGLTDRFGINWLLICRRKT